MNITYYIETNGKDLLLGGHKKDWSGNKLIEFKKYLLIKTIGKKTNYIHPEPYDRHLKQFIK